jgi:hypothetical protein
MTIWTAWAETLVEIVSVRTITAMNVRGLFISKVL